MTISTEAIGKLDGQDDDGQFELASLTQQYAARMVENFLTNYSTLAEHADDEKLYQLTMDVIAALRDIQVRDYALGLKTAENELNMVVGLTTLISNAPKEYISAPACILSSIFYESGNKELAMQVLDEANEDYSLAILLKRVFAADWKPESFASMRNELHPKVIASIFGEDN